MKVREASVAINGNVTINGSVTVNGRRRGAADKELSELQRLVRQIRDNPRDSEATEKLIARYRNLIRRMVSSHLAQRSQHEYLEKVAQETIWEIAKGRDLDIEGFSSYIRCAMAKRIERAIAHEYLLYIPEEIRYKLWKLEQFIWSELGSGYGDAYRAQLDWTKERKDMAMNVLGTDENELTDLLGWLVLTGVDPLLTKEDDESGDDGGVSDKSLDLADENADVPGQVIRKELGKELRTALDRFCTKEQVQALGLKYGLFGGPVLSYSRIGEELSRNAKEPVTKTDAKRIVRQARRSLRENAPELYSFPVSFLNLSAKRLQQVTESVMFGISPK